MNAHLTILKWFWDGKITLGDCMARLDKLQIRGAFRDDASFIGYDYRQQLWVDEPLTLANWSDPSVPYPCPSPMGRGKRPAPRQRAWNRA